MSLNKAIKYKKEKRKEYTGAKAVACSCRNHGTCDWCKNNRLYQSIKTDSFAKKEIKEWKEGTDE